MIAHYYPSSDISQSLLYGRNPMKGGEILIASNTDISASPEEQARDWELLSNDYRTKCVCIVISFSKAETEWLRSQNDHGCDKVRTLMLEYIQALKEKGNDITECPYIATRHGNTDCEHYHLYFLTTNIHGRQYRDNHIKKNVTRAAAKIALRYGLEGAPKAMANEKAHQEAEGTRRKERTERKHRPSATQAEIDERIRRREAARKAEKRRQRLKYIVESAGRKAQESPNPEECFLNLLTEEHIHLFIDDKKGLCLSMTDEDGKTRRYSLQKDLGIDMSCIPDLEIMKPKEKEDEANIRKPLMESLRPSQTGASSGPTVRRAPKHVGGIGPSRNAEHEVGNHKSEDDPDWEWKRRNGYSL